MPFDAAVADRSPRGTVVVRGTDATSFLQSLVSQDLSGIADGAGARSLLLGPQGKLDVAFRALHLGEGDLGEGDGEWWLDCEADHAARLAASLQRFKLRVDATIDDETAARGLVSVLGSDAAALVEAALGVAVPERQHAHVAGAALRIARADWPDRPGVDVLGPRPAVDAASVALLEAGGRRMDADAFEAMRIVAGVPRLGVDVDERTIPQEAFYERDSISFTKGCFLGQELVTRIDTRGHVNRYLRRLAVEGSVVPSPGAVITADAKVVGEATSAIADPSTGRVVALGMVRREVEPPVTLQLRWDAGEATASLLSDA